MRQLLPRAADDALVADVYADLASLPQAEGSRPYVVLNMVSSADGAISVEGLSGGLSGSQDKEVFFFLRSVADVILVGAGTARAENYGRAKLSPELVAQREARGQQPLPRIALVSKSMRMDWSARLFTESRPYIICPANVPADQLAAARSVAEVIVAGQDEVDLAAGLATLAAEGAGLVLCEGGPTLNGQLLADGLVDELCLTVSPALVGGLGKRITGWAQAREALPLRLISAAESADVLLLRYAVGGAKEALQD